MGTKTNNLDKKLKQLDLEFLHGVPVHLNDEMIEQIEQAFIDEGWVHGDQAKVLQELMNLKANTEAAIHRLGMSRVEGEDRMTGQEWYERMLKNLDRRMVYNHNLRIQDAFVSGMNYAMRAAEEAAGIESYGS